MEGAAAYVRPVDRLTPARKADTARCQIAHGKSLLMEYAYIGQHQRRSVLTVQADWGQSKVSWYICGVHSPPCSDLLELQ